MFIDMVKYKERIIPTEAARQDLLLEKNFSLNWNPPIAAQIPITYFIPAFTKRFEKLWEDDLRTQDNLFYLNKKTWKPVQHYVRYTAFPPSTRPWMRIPWKTTSLTGSTSRLYLSKVPSTGPDQLLMIDHPSLSSLWGKFGDHVNGLPSMFAEQVDKSFVPKPTGLDSLVERSLRTMLPGIKSSVSLVNFLIELKDFRKLPQTLSQMGSVGRKMLSLQNKPSSYVLPALFKRIRTTFDRSAGLTLREITHTTADAYLQAEFGILPFLRDIADIASALGSVLEDINRLVHNQGRPQFRRFVWSEISNQFASPTTVAGPYVYNLGQFAGSVSPPGTTGCARAFTGNVRFEREVVIDIPTTFRAQVQYNYYLTKAQTEHARLWGLYDALGINLNPAIIWNAIPWTFLIDWLVNVSSWLGRRKVLNLEPGVNISRYLWSYTASRRIRTSLYSTDTLQPTIGRTYLPDLYETVYRRDIGLPTKTSLLNWSGLDSRELSLGAALVVTRAIKPNRRLRV